MTATEPRVLLVEDNPDDVEMTLLAFRMDRIPADFVVARDGAEALDRLFSMNPAPSLVLLDLKLPRVDGVEVLRRMRADERTRRIPVVVLSSSNEEADARRTQEIGIERYVRKPVDFLEFRRAARLLADTWLRPEAQRGESPA